MSEENKLFVKIKKKLLYLKYMKQKEEKKSWGIE